MSDRIIKPNGEAPPPVPEQPVSMDDLLNRAHNAWQFKRKDEAVRYMIAGMRLISQGMAQIIRDIDEIKKRNE